MFNSKKPPKIGGNKPNINKPFFSKFSRPFFNNHNDSGSDSDSDYEERDYYSKLTYMTNGWVTINKNPGKSIAIETIYSTSDNRIIKIIYYDVIKQDGKTYMKYIYQIRCDKNTKK